MSTHTRKPPALHIGLVPHVVGLALPLVKQGIFRITSDGMYLFGFSLFWAIAVGFDSSAALLVAAYSHLYIGLHFHTTEKPDMKFLYGP